MLCWSVLHCFLHTMFDGFGAPFWHPLGPLLTRVWTSWQEFLWATVLRLAGYHFMSSSLLCFVVISLRFGSPISVRFWAPLGTLVGPQGLFYEVMFGTKCWLICCLVWSQNGAQLYWLVGYFGRRFGMSNWIDLWSHLGVGSNWASCWRIFGAFCDVFGPR